MDFVEGLPKSHLMSVVFMVVPKYVHFMPLSHPYTAAKVANLYHSLPSNCMVCLPPLLVIGILYLPPIFGRS